MNGKDVPIDQFDGPTGEEFTASIRRFQRDQQQRFYDHGAGVNPDALPSGGRAVHGNPSRMKVPPRLHKHRGGSVDGVRFK